LKADLTVFFLIFSPSYHGVVNFLKMREIISKSKSLHFYNFSKFVIADKDG